MRAVRDRMVFAPPPSIDEEPIAEFVARAVHAIDPTHRDVKPAGLLQ